MPRTPFIARAIACRRTHQPTSPVISGVHPRGKPSFKAAGVQKPRCPLCSQRPRGLRRLAHAGVVPLTLHATLKNSAEVMAVYCGRTAPLPPCRSLSEHACSLASGRLSGRQVRLKADLPWHFTLTPKQWINATGAVGIVSKRGRYGGTFAHKDIAFEFASSSSRVIQLFP